MCALDDLASIPKLTLGLVVQEVVNLGGSTVVGADGETLVGLSSWDAKEPETSVLRRPPSQSCFHYTPRRAVVWGYSPC